MSGDGAYISNKSALDVASGNPDLESFWVPAGTGGGCVLSGPFENYTVNLGPVDLVVYGGLTTANPYNDTGIFSWNPRCLKRDLTDYINQKMANASNALDAMTRYDDIANFQMLFQGMPADQLEGGNTLGVDGGGEYQSWGLGNVAALEPNPHFSLGHWSLGGDPGRDFSVSPGDPVSVTTSILVHMIMMPYTDSPTSKGVLSSSLYGGPLVVGLADARPRLSSLRQQQYRRDKHVSQQPS